MAKKKTVEDLKAGLTFGNSQNVDTQNAASAAAAVDTEPEQKMAQEPAASAEPIADSSAPVKMEQEPVVVPPEQKDPVPGSGQSLAEIYREKFQPADEKRTERIQIVVTPTVSRKLDELVRDRKIKSKNDLINFLLEGYLENIQ